MMTLENIFERCEVLIDDRTTVKVVLLCIRRLFCSVILVAVLVFPLWVLASGYSGDGKPIPFWAAVGGTGLGVFVLSFCYSLTKALEDTSAYREQRRDKIKHPNWERAEWVIVSFPTLLSGWILVGIYSSCFLCAISVLNYVE